MEWLRSFYELKRGDGCEMCAQGRPDETPYGVRFLEGEVNYELLGNALPHQHTHVLPRYAEDPKPGWPFPHPEQAGRPIFEDELWCEVEALRA